MKAFVYFRATVEMELDDRYHALKDGNWYYDKVLDKMMSDCLTDAEMKLVETPLNTSFDIEAYAVEDEEHNILAEI